MKNISEDPLSIDDIHRPTKFIRLATKSFDQKLEKIRKSDPIGSQRIEKVIARILGNPQDADGMMKGVHHNRLKKYVGRKDYRIIYHWCEQCRKEREQQEHRCDFCDKVKDHSVVFFDLYHKNEIAHLKHMR